MKMRRSVLDTRPEFHVPLEDDDHMEYIAESLPSHVGSATNASCSTELFLRDSTTVGPGGTADVYVNLSEVPPPTFAARLQLVLNAWYQLRLAGESTVFFGDNPPDPAAYGYDFAQLPANGSVAQAVVDASCRLFCSRSTQATLTHSVEVFAYSTLWLALLFISSAVLLATGLAGTALRGRALAPDMLGYVASMTYNNRYLPLPVNGGSDSALDAMERVRILGHLRVAVGDVAGDEEVGRLAFTANPHARPLQKGRKYI
jgi:hypothetical protein